MKIGLVLGGGGSRGLAHIGVLKVLIRERIRVDLIVGTSMGGIVGACFALGIPPERMVDAFSALQNQSWVNLKLFSAHARQSALRDTLSTAFEGKTFADLQIPTTLMAVDMGAGKEIPLNTGSLLDAALATSAVPALFPPVSIDGMQLADGGVIDSLAPHIAFEQGAQAAIVVDVEPPLEMDNPWVDPLSAIVGSQLPLPFRASGSSETPGVLSAAWRAFRVMRWHFHMQRLAAHPPSLLLRPDVAQRGSLDFKDLESLVLAGVAEAERHLGELEALAGP